MKISSRVQSCPEKHSHQVIRIGGKRKKWPDNPQLSNRFMSLETASINAWVERFGFDELISGSYHSSSFDEESDTNGYDAIPSDDCERDEPMLCSPTRDPEEQDENEIFCFDQDEIFIPNDFAIVDRRRQRSVSIYRLPIQSDPECAQSER